MLRPTWSFCYDETHRNGLFVPSGLQFHQYYEALHKKRELVIVTALSRNKLKIKEELHLKPKWSMFHVLFQNHQHFKKNNASISWSKLSGKLNNDIRISGGQVVLELCKMQNIVLINNPQNAWPTKILMPILSFSVNLFQDYFSKQC